MVSSSVINLLEHPVYGVAQVDRLLGLHPGTARRWIDGYDRGGKSYPAVVREQRTGDEVVTWGEFVETRLLSEYRDAGVSLIHMRPVVVRLREELGTKYPLASAKTWLEVDGRELVRKIQGEVGLQRKLALVEVLRTGQQALAWSKPADDFRKSIEWTDETEPRLQSLHPAHDLQAVTIDPLRGFGEPVVRNTRTEILAELYSAGDSIEAIADVYELEPDVVDQAVRYELRVAQHAVKAAA